MSNYRYSGIILLCVFFVIVFAVAFTSNPRFPVQVIAGESSTGTWMSGVLLVISAATSLMHGMRQHEWRWFIIAVFFLLLAVDEHFMFHEQVKEHLIFADHKRSRWIYELPVLAGAGAGGIISFLLWRLLSGGSRILLVCAVVMGTLSVSMDVLTLGVLFEDVFKILGELAVACGIVLNVNTE